MKRLKSRFGGRFPTVVTLGSFPQQFVTGALGFAIAGDFFDFRGRPRRLSLRVHFLFFGFFAFVCVLQILLPNTRANILSTFLS